MLTILNDNGVNKMTLTATESILLDKYGHSLTVKELAEVVKVSAATIRNKISDETFPIPTYKTGRKRLADFRDVATFIDANRPAA